MNSHKSQQSRYTRAQDDYIMENYHLFPKPQIAAAMSTPYKEITANMVIGRYHRIKDKYVASGIKMTDLQKLDSLIRDGMRCKMANNGCRDPLAFMILRDKGTTCNHPGCRNNKVSSGLCSVHNADRLAKLPRPNRGSEISTSVCAGYMG